jgi:chemotaxis protein CheX
MQTAVQTKPAKLNSSMIMPFVQSTKKVFETLVEITPEITKPYLKQGAGATYEVSGMIGFSGEIVGSVVVSFQMETARKLVNAISRMEIDPKSPDFCDAIGELANMIAGSAKDDLGKKASIAVPTVIIGGGHTIGRLTGVPCIVIPCKTPFGEFAVEVNIMPTV